MYKMRDKIKLGCILLGLSSSLLALPEDNKAIIHVRAGSADISQQTHLGTYSGGVALDQGSTHIRATKATTQGNDTHQLIKAIIEGDATTQAHYWSLVSKEKPIMHAFADKIIYYPLSQEIELVGHARVEQGKHSFAATVIRYNIKTQHVSTQPLDGQQTTILIQPEQSS